MPPPGAGLYNIESNMIVMNPDRDVNDDEEEYNSDDYFFHGKQKAVEFEMVKFVFGFGCQSMIAPSVLITYFFI